MIRKLLSVLFVFMMLLTACKPASSTEAPPTEAPTQVIKPTVQATSVTSASQPGCTVTSRSTNSETEGESLIPPVGEKDWVKGSPDAYATIIEYGDFQ